MEGMMLAAVTALWLGILTSISPCPLATNVVAMSFIARDVGTSRTVLLTGILYMIGRTLAYVILGSLLAASLLSIPQVSNFLQTHMNNVLGPVLILVGMVLLGLITVNLSGSVLVGQLHGRAESWGTWGAVPLGMIFALAFCPVSAALFFGSLIPLSIKSGSSILLPSLYGIGTGLPVFGFAFLIAFGARSVSKALDRVGQVERWARRATGVIFVVVGIYFALAYTFGIFS